MELSSHHDEAANIPLPINSSFVNVHAHIHHGHITHHNQHNNIIPPLNNSIGGTNSTTTTTNATIIDEDDHHYHRNHQGDTTNHKSNNGNNHDDLGFNNLKKTMIITYRECQKNHAASMGGNATDGCGEFMQSGEEGTIDSFTCSACNCHRNFHRKEIQGENYHHIIPPLSTTHSHFYPSTLHSHLLDTRGRKVISGNTGPLFPFSRSLTINMPPSYTLSDHHHIMVRPHEQHNQVVKKRFRTKFSQEQKEKMLEFAEKVGWKIQKQEESVVQQFCQQIGVKRSVLKVWMHNNKYNLAKKNENIIVNNIINHPSP